MSQDEDKKHGKVKTLVILLVMVVGLYLMVIIKGVE
jgi:hypothetical protein